MSSDLNTSAIDCFCNGRKNNGELFAEKGKATLEPVSTLDHIAKIQCPVVCCLFLLYILVMHNL